MDIKLDIQITKSKTVYIFLKDFFFAEADSNYTDIYTVNDAPYKTVRLLLGELEDKINDCGTYKYHHILRAGRKFIINTDYLVGVDVLNHKIKVQQPGQKVIELNLFKTEARKLYEQLERDKKAKVLQTISLRQKLTVPVSEIKNGSIWVLHRALFGLQEMLMPRIPNQQEHIATGHQFRNCLSQQESSGLNCRVNVYGLSVRPMRVQDFYSSVLTAMHSFFRALVMLGLKSQSEIMMSEEHTGQQLRLVRI